MASKKLLLYIKVCIFTSVNDIKQFYYINDLFIDFWNEKLGKILYLPTFLIYRYALEAHILVQENPILLKLTPTGRVGAFLSFPSSFYGLLLGTLHEKSRSVKHD